MKRIVLCLKLLAFLKNAKFFLNYEFKIYFTHTHTQMLD